MYISCQRNSGEAKLRRRRVLCVCVCVWPQGRSGCASKKTLRLQTSAKRTWRLPQLLRWVGSKYGTADTTGRFVSRSSNKCTGELATMRRRRNSTLGTKANRESRLLEACLLCCFFQSKEKRNKNERNKKKQWKCGRHCNPRCKSKDWDLFVVLFVSVHGLRLQCLRYLHCTFIYIFYFIVYFPPILVSTGFQNDCGYYPAFVTRKVMALSTFLCETSLPRPPASSATAKPTLEPQLMTGSTGAAYG